jgi:hypothetical protein
MKMSIANRQSSRKSVAVFAFAFLVACTVASADTPKPPSGAHIVVKRHALQVPGSPAPARSLPSVQNPGIDAVTDALKQAKSVVEGQLQIENCRITHGLEGAVSFFDNSRRIDMGQVSFQRVTDEFSSATNFKIKGLAAGPHTLRVALTPAIQRECAGGNWLPEEHRFSIASGFTTVSRMNFRYQRNFTNRTIFGSVITGQVQRLFNGTQMRINNLGPQHGTSNHLPNDSVIRFPASLDGREIRFNIPEFKSGPYRYYVQDINLRLVTTQIEGEFFRLTLHLEGSGPEFRGFCVTGNVLCLPGRDDAAPDVQWSNDPRVEVLLRPIAREGSITFGEVQVRVRGDIQARGICSAIDVCHLATNYDREIQRAIQNSFRAFLNQTSIRRMVAQAIRPALDGLGIGHVMTAELRNGQLVLSFLPAV